MKSSIYLYVLILAGFASCSRSLNPTGAPVTELQPVMPAMSMQHAYYADNDSLKLHLLIEDNNGVLDAGKHVSQVLYEVRSGKNERDALLLRDSVLIGTNRVVDSEGGLYITLQVPATVVRKPNVVNLQVWMQLGDDEQMGSLFQLPLNAEMMMKRHMLLEAASGRPIIRQYITTSHKVKIKSTADSSSIAVLYMNKGFAPALPPMSTRPVKQMRTLPVADTLFVSTEDTLQLNKEGLYLLWADKPYAEGMLVQPWAYPDVTMANELIEPLIYLTTSEERKKLYETADPKKAVDAFWLQVAGGNVVVAKQLIKEFYGRVETANKLYTSHEAGWATDRGMLHIIFGQPDEVVQANGDLIWTYRQTRVRPYIKFIFKKKPNTFTENHYELVRLRDYQEVWYSTVAKWRAGITEI